MVRGFIRAYSASCARNEVRRVRRLRVCEAYDRDADREICAAHAIRAEKVAISAGALYGCPWSPVD